MAEQVLLLLSPHPHPQQSSLCFCSWLGGGRNREAGPGEGLISWGGEGLGTAAAVLMPLQPGTNSLMLAHYFELRLTLGWHSGHETMLSEVWILCDPVLSLYLLSLLPFLALLQLMWASTLCVMAGLRLASTRILCHHVCQPDAFAYSKSTTAIISLTFGSHCLSGSNPMLTFL